MPTANPETKNPKFLCLLFFKSCNLKKRQPFQIVTLQEKLTNVREKNSGFVDSCQKRPGIYIQTLKSPSLFWF